MSGQAAHKPSAKAKVQAARLMAVQALYQADQNDQGAESVVQEYLATRTGMEVDGEIMVQPDGALLKAIVLGAAARRGELEAVIQANFNNKNRELEPLLAAILLCGAYELMAHGETDSPIIINDYLNVTHGFYTEGEAKLVNAVLDSVAKVFRS